jgi:hypothetical protein
MKTQPAAVKTLAKYKGASPIFIPIFHWTHVC